MPMAGFSRADSQKRHAPAEFCERGAIDALAQPASRC